MPWNAMLKVFLFVVAGIITKYFTNTHTHGRTHARVLGISRPNHCTLITSSLVCPSPGPQPRSCDFRARNICMNRRIGYVAFYPLVDLPDWTKIIVSISFGGK